VLRVLAGFAALRGAVDFIADADANFVCVSRQRKFPMQGARSERDRNGDV
jgi:hypothetical protein